MLTAGGTSSDKQGQGVTDERQGSGHHHGCWRHLVMCVEDRGSLFRTKS
jgi:hypothetical protein